MRTIRTATFVSLDGVMQGPGGPDEDPTGGFRFGGWNFPFWDEPLERLMSEAMGEDYDLLLGRKTYEIFAAHWPHATDDPMADVLNRATKYVVSTTLGTADWRNSILIRPGERDVPDQLRRLKEQDGPEIQVHGSGQLIQTLLKHDLVDRYRLMIFPVLLGSGKRLFAEGTVPTALRLVESATFSKGAVHLIYERAGKPTFGRMA